MSASAELDLRAEAAREPLPVIDLGRLEAVDPAGLSAARANWRDRMVSEHVSARVFAALVPMMMRAGLSRRHVVATGEMVREEREHARLCARVLAALGGEPVAPMPAELPPVPEHGDASPLEAVLRNLISVSCCSETVAVALVGTEREQAGAPALRAILQRILSDEVGHSRLGWAILAEVAPGLDARTRARLSAYLVTAFAHQIDFHAPFLEMGEVGDDALAVGAPSGAGNWLVFVRTMTDVVVPGLERHGLAAGEAWSEVLRARSPIAA